MATRAQMRGTLRRLIRDNVPQDLLTADIGTADTTIRVSLGVYSGSPQTFQVGSELIHARSWDASVNSYTNCIRGYSGSTAAAHLAGDAVVIEPRWSDLDINDALNSAINRMNALGLYRIKSLNLTYNASIAGYDLASDCIDVYEVHTKPPDATEAWVEIDAYKVLQDMPTADFASGVGIRLDRPAYAGQTIRVKYRARYGNFSDDTTDSAAAGIGVQTFCADIPVLGARVELVKADELGRTQITSAQEANRAEDTPAGSISSVGRVLDAHFQMRCSEALNEISRQFPIKVRAQALY